jgi:putative transposase
MRFQFIREHLGEFEVAVMCRVLEVTRAGFYAWRKRAPGPRALEEAALRQKATAIFEASRRTYGHRRIRAALHAQGVVCGLKRVARLMKKWGMQVEVKRKFRVTTDSKHGLPIAENLLNRQFNVEIPNRYWVSDITYIWTDEGWLFLATTMDLYSRKLVGWAMDDHMRAELVIDALQMAIVTRAPGPGLIHHSDRGSQYASKDFRAVLDRHGMVASMSRKGDCWDNAVMESFYRTLKVERVRRERYQDRRQAKSAVFEFIEAFYNTIRIHSTLDYLSPAEFERTNRASTEAA